MMSRPYELCPPQPWEGRWVVSECDRSANREPKLCLLRFLCLFPLLTPHGSSSFSQDDRSPRWWWSRGSRWCGTGTRCS